MAAAQPILVGQFGAAHGVRGEIRLKSFTEAPEQIADYKTLRLKSGVAVKLVSLRPQGSMLVARVESVDDRTAAEALTGAELFVDRAELAEPEEDEFYQADLVGLEVRDPEGAKIGVVTAVQDFGAGDIIEIRPEKGAGFMVAFTRDNFPEVNVAGGYLVVHRPAETEAH